MVHVDLSECTTHLEVVLGIVLLECTTHSDIIHLDSVPCIVRLDLAPLDLIQCIVWVMVLILVTAMVFQIMLGILHQSIQVI